MRALCLLQALVRAAAGGHEGVVRTLLTWPRAAPAADCQDGQALVCGAAGGHETVVRFLLSWPVHPPRADCQDGAALAWAAAGGHETVVRFLLSWPQQDVCGPRADCQVQLRS